MAGLALTAGLVLGADPAAAQPLPPADPAVAQADAAADEVAGRIGALSVELFDAQAAVQTAQAASAIALDDYQAREAAFQAADAAARQAAATAERAAADLADAREALVAFARGSFITHSTHAGAEALVTSGDPAELAERAALLEAAGAHRSTEVDRFGAARRRADAAAAAAQASLDRAGALQRQAADALTVAQEAERAARRQAEAVAGQQAGLRRELDRAQADLAALVGEEQAAARVAELLAASAGPMGTDPVARTVAGPGSAGAVRTAIAAATAVVGTPYSWGGGGAAGAGRGIGLDRDVVGFDCSGLTQYAYARAGVAVPRNSRAQFAALPAVARADLQPGDLVFWATDPRDPATIHHVAIWLGDGRVVQAPQSGDVVKISTMWWSGYAGTVRPSAA